MYISLATSVCPLIREADLIYMPLSDYEEDEEAREQMEESDENLAWPNY